jgi:hypothetical protein
VTTARRVLLPILLGVLALLGSFSGCGFPDYTFRDLDGAGALDASDGSGGTQAGGSGGMTPMGGRGGGGMSGAGTGGLPAADAAAGTPGITDGGFDAPVDAEPPVVECTRDEDCSQNAHRLLCDTSRGVCIECVAGATSCPLGTFCTAEGDCALGCSAHGDCESSGELPAIDGGADAAAGGIDASSVDSGDEDASLDAAGVIVLDGGVVECRGNQCVGCASDVDCPPGGLCRLGRCENGCSPTHPCPSGFDCCNGVCADVTDDVRHCGACDARCAPPGGVGLCREGACFMAGCRPGFGDCNGDLSDGCEVDLRSDRNRCGTCDTSCSAPPNADAACRDSQCGLGECVANFEDCDGKPENGCEVNLLANAANCGACGAACALEDANPVCTAGSCEIASCAVGYRDCDTSAINGCEVRILDDPTNCGSCENTCSLANANVGCSAYACTVVSCEAPSANCDGQPANGCEVDTSTDVNNCGGCTQACALLHATAACSGGACAIESCDSGWKDCNGDPDGGCETNVNGSESNCGDCGVVCSTNHTLTSACTLGTCTITCAANFDDCDGDVSNGCETDLRTNVDHCDQCDFPCPAGPGQTANCVNRTCGTSSCAAGSADCDGDVGTGCEVDTTTDVSNCGACGKACFVPNGTATCNNGQCVVASCDPGFDDCTSALGCETRLNTLSNCGACNSSCALPNATTTCVTGTCAISFCTQPYASCDDLQNNGCEVNTQASTAHCGGCGNACSSQNGVPSCINGSCAITCNPGFGNCNATAADGCERATTNDVANCGACGVVCAVQNGAPGCNGTACVVASCTAPFVDCDGQYGTGCETNTNDNEEHCGACNASCNLPNAVSSCSLGECVIDVCIAPFEDCDGNAANGCETDFCP